MLHLTHRCQFMGGMCLLFLFCLLFLLFPLLHLIHLHLHMFHFPQPLLHLQCLELTFPLLLFALSASDVPEISGSQSNGPFQIATDSQGSRLQLLSPQTRQTATLMTPWTSFMLVQRLLPSPHLTGSHNNALMQICGIRHVRKRWRLTG
jgi:hypothetical protein